MKALPYLTAAIVAFGFCACDSKEEKLHKEALENKADALEDAAKQTKKNAELTAKADNLEGERKAEALKNEAERTRDKK